MRSLSAAAKKIGYGFQRLGDSLYLNPRELTKQRFAARESREHLRTVYPLDASSVVVDVGGYEGQWASDIFARYLCDVHVFEPIPSFHDRIVTRFAQNPHIHAYAVALGDSDGKVVFHEQADGTSAFGATGTEITVDQVNASSYFDRLGLKKIDLIKINIEGGEYALLPDLIRSGWIGRITDVQVQFHDIGPDAKAKMERIREDLAKTHEPTYQYDFIWENWRRKTTV